MLLIIILDQALVQWLEYVSPPPTTHHQGLGDATVCMLDLVLKVEINLSIYLLRWKENEIWANPDSIKAEFSSMFWETFRAITSWRFSWVLLINKRDLLWEWFWFVTWYGWMLLTSTSLIWTHTIVHTIIEIFPLACRFLRCLMNVCDLCGLFSVFMSYIVLA